MTNTAKNWMRGLAFTNGLAAIVAAFALMASTPNLAAADVDGCDEDNPSTSGCGCLDPTWVFPAGCYEEAGPGFRCWGGNDCED